MSRNGSPLITMRDDYGYKADPSYTIDERYAEAGVVWRVNTARAAIADTEAMVISFTTPATGQCFIDHTKAIIYGNVVDIDILEGPTLAGGSALTPRNLSRVWSTTPDTGCPITDFKTGTTPTGGTSIFAEMLGGGTTPATRASGDSSSDSWLALKPSTVYMLRATAVGAVTWAQLILRVACLSTQ